MSKDVIVILDNVRSAHNIGSIMRTMDCVGYNHIYLCGICATPKLLPGSKKLKKTALAAYQNIKWEYYKNSLDALKKAKTSGYKVYIIEQSQDSKKLEEFQFEFPAAFVFGHEVSGVDNKLFKFADELISLPNVGESHSWNVSNTVAVVLWEAWKNCKLK